MRYKWIIPRVDGSKRRLLESELGIDALLAHILVQRGIDSPDEAMRFLNPSLDYLYPPELMADMEKAVSIILNCAANNERIVIYGDYDVDGITSSAVLYETLIEIGVDADVFIPDRIKEGYGLTREAVDRCLSLYDPDLIITVDCGIRAVDVIADLKAQGIKVIVTDHHIPADRLPPADAILNPKLKGCAYPYKELSGVGIVYKLASFILRDERKFLDLTTLGTIADVVPLLGENRIIVHYGLEAVSNSRRPGITALMEEARLASVSVRSIGFVIGPRLNAAGRLSSAMDAFELLTSQDLFQARKIARLLDGRNADRQRIQEDMFQEALSQAKRQAQEGATVLVVCSDDWHPGVVGIIASKLVERFSRPSIAIALDSGVGRGSGRSLGDFDITGAISAAGHLLESFGGHKGAAGLSIRSGNIERFFSEINVYALHHRDKMVPSLRIDGRLRLDMLSFNLLEDFERLAPFGEGNERPLFLFQGLRIKGGIRKMARGAIKFWVTDGRLSIPVVGFGFGEEVEEISSASKIDIVAAPLLNSFNGWQEPQLELKDWRRSV